MYNNVVVLFMKNMTKEIALTLLEEGYQLNPGKWVQHSFSVGNIAYLIALQMGLDAEKAQIMGYLHDIGKRFGKEATHSVSGYQFLESEGYEIDYANICMVHAYLNHDIECTVGHPHGQTYQYRKQFVEQYEYTIYDEIIMLCDLLCKGTYVGLDNRLNDAYMRYGNPDNMGYHREQALLLKQKIENRMGITIEQLLASNENGIMYKK